jgi:hypothetical protein
MRSAIEANEIEGSPTAGFFGLYDTCWLDRSAKDFSAMGIAMSTVCNSAAERA